MADSDSQELSKNSRPQIVLVSGCFDLLHSGHVAFFKEAASLGELHVRLGTDENIVALKGHAPMYSNEERLEMVRAIRWVHSAKLSVGKGRFDFFDDMDQIKPDVYFCNEDASEMQTRVDHCNNVGVRMVVKPRKPTAGLAERSSTSMKARLRDMISKDENCVNNVEAYHQVFPWRLCFAGGWMDLKWCNELYPGCVVTINFKHHPGICEDMCGLATSSRKHAIKLWNGRVPKYLSPGEAARSLYGTENFNHFAKHEGDIVDWEKRSYSAGSQDHMGLFFPGINRLNYDGSHWPKEMIHLNDPDDPAQAKMFRWLESVLHVVRIPFESRPPGFNSQRINNLTDKNIPLQRRQAMVKNLADASDMAWRGIVAMDAAMLGRGLSGTMAAWEEALPYTVDPYGDDDCDKSAALRSFWKKYDAPHTHGCLFSGAGGGYLFVISDEPVAGGMKLEINHDAIVKPTPSDTLASAPHAVPDA